MRICRFEFLRYRFSLQALESYSKAVWSGGGRAPLMHIAKLHQELGQPQQALEAIERYSQQNISACRIETDVYSICILLILCAIEPLLIIWWHGAESIANARAAFECTVKISLVACTCFVIYFRAIHEDGDPRDTGPLLQAGLILESFGSFKEAAVSKSHVCVFKAETLCMVVRPGGQQILRERWPCGADDGGIFS